MSSYCEKSWVYLKGWADSDDRLHGIIATWWDSSETRTDPHVLNHVPVVEGFCALYERFGDSLYRDEAQRWSNFLHESFDAGSGLFQNAWADVPSKPTGVLQQALVSGALIRVARLTGEEWPLQTAIANLRACDSRWPDPLLNGVVNQALVYADAVCRLRELAPGEFRNLSRRFPSLIAQVSECVRPVVKGGKLIEQSYHDSLLMTVYQIACLPGLCALAKAGQSPEHLFQLVSDVARGVLENLYLGDGRFGSHIPPSRILHNPIALRGLGLLRRLPIGARGHAAVERLRRSLNRVAGRPSVVVPPVWLARFAGSALALKSAAPFLHFPVGEVLSALDRRIKRSQLDHGGVPNCEGAWKDGKPAWQSLVCSTRWNAHVFRYFAESCDRRPEASNAVPGDCAWGDASVSISEDTDRVRAVLGDGKGIATWQKPQARTR